MSTATSMGAAALAAAAKAATVARRAPARRGLNDLRVLASFLASRAREQHVVLDKSKLRAVTIAYYIDLCLLGGHALLRFVLARPRCSGVGAETPRPHRRSGGADGTMTADVGRRDRPARPHDDRRGPLGRAERGRGYGLVVVVV